jgi:hypothetical protein
MGMETEHGLSIYFAFLACFVKLHLAAIQKTNGFFLFFLHKSLERLLLISSRGTLRTSFGRSKKRGVDWGLARSKAKVDLLVMGGNIALR